jgi:hypothetical protein
MEPIKAFVGHSFADIDKAVVQKILNHLTMLTELHPNFSWEHAEHPEPRVIDAKVLALLEGKNLFIGICTRKERVIAHDELSQPWYRPNTLTGNAAAFNWKTSDWVIQEIGLAIGRGLNVILLLEEGTRPPGAIQGNLEYVLFSRIAPERCFDTLIGMIAALSPRVALTPGVAKQASPLDDKKDESFQRQSGHDWTEPTAEWKRRDYEIALMHTIAVGDEDKANRINTHFLASSEAADDASRRSWEAGTLYGRIIFGKGAKLPDLQRLAQQTPDNSDIEGYLARSYLHYEEFGVAAEAFERAADKEATVRKRIQLLGACRAFPPTPSGRRLGQSRQFEQTRTA